MVCHYVTYMLICYIQTFLDHGFLVCKHFYHYLYLVIQVRNDNNGCLATLTPDIPRIPLDLVVFGVMVDYRGRDMLGTHVSVVFCKVVRKDMIFGFSF